MLAFPGASLVCTVGPELQATKRVPTIATERMDVNLITLII